MDTKNSPETPQSGGRDKELEQNKNPGREVVLVGVIVVVMLAIGVAIYAWMDGSGEPQQQDLTDYNNQIEAFNDEMKNKTQQEMEQSLEALPTE